MPQVSVVMAVRDGAATIRRAVRSILDQAHVDLELVVVDDGSTDDTFALLAAMAEPRLVLSRQRAPVGLTLCLNHALTMARAPVIARMDADDEALPNRLAAQLAALEQGADICFCDCVNQDEGGRRWTVPPPPALLRAWRCLFTNDFGAHPAAMMRRSVLDAVGGYDPRFARGQDYDLWDRCAAAGATFTYVRQPLLVYHVHGASVSSLHSTEQWETARIVSERALGRLFPESSLAERRGLRWLMQERTRAEAAEIGEALSLCLGRVAAFAERRGNHGEGGRSLWRHVSGRIARRLPEMPAALRRQAMAVALLAAVRSRSPSALGRLAREILRAGGPDQSSRSSGFSS